MADFAEFTALLSESMNQIRSRLDADVNAGVSPQDPSFIDTSVGGFYWDLSQTLALEVERLWDFLATEVPAASFLAYAWGEYLDEHAVLLGLERRDATRATGFVTFTGKEGSMLPTGVQVAVPQTDPDSEEQITFQTTDSGTIGLSETLTLAVEAVEVGTASNISAGAISLLLTPVEGIASVANEESTSGGFDVESDEIFRDRLIREAGAPPAAGNIADYERWSLEYPGVGKAVVNPIWAGPGSVQVILTDYNNRPVPAAVEEAVQDIIDPFFINTEIKETEYTSGATMKVASTTGFREGTALTPQRLNLNDQIVTYTGQTSTSFTGCSGSTGNFPIGTKVYQGGRGEGKAPIGADVTVDTPTQVPVNVEGNFVLYEGYSIGEEGGATDISEALKQRITEYIDSLPAGESVRIKHVEAQTFKVTGVKDITSLKLNGGTSNVAIASAPPKIAVTGTVTLS